MPPPTCLETALLDLWLSWFVPFASCVWTAWSDFFPNGASVLSVRCGILKHLENEQCGKAVAETYHLDTAFLKGSISSRPSFPTPSPFGFLRSSSPQLKELGELKLIAMSGRRPNESRQAPCHKRIQMSCLLHNMGDAGCHCGECYAEDSMQITACSLFQMKFLESFKSSHHFKSFFRCFPCAIARIRRLARRQEPDRLSFRSLP